MTRNTNKWGYQPSLRRRAIRKLCKFLIFVLRLDGRSKFSNEFMQLLDPKFETSLNGQKLQFRTGNGRLLWRAKTFLTEEPLMISWILDMQPNDVVMDIGANVGTYTVPIAQKVKRVYACELDPLNVAILKENIVLNAVHDRVLIIPIACGNKLAAVEIEFRDLAYGDALQSIAGGDTLESVRGKKSHSMKSLQISLDEVFLSLDLEWPNKIKVDVDGNEETVLNGAKSLLARANEIYFEDSKTEACRTFIEFLNSKGFVEYDYVEIFKMDREKRSVGFNRIFRK
jgi:FkbM family methyltransferase